MIVVWMLYAALVAALFGLAARALEVTLRALGRPTRWLWTGAILASVVTPAVMIWLGSQPEPPTLPTLTVLSLPAMAFGVANGPSESALLDLPTLLTAAWTVATIVLAAWLLIGWLRLRRELGRCEVRKLGEIEVLVSDRLGPAVTAGPNRKIVVPRWLLTEDDATIRTVLDHEQAHLAARDAELILAAAVPAILLPWNFALWWQLGRLRLAVEMDCDQRVIAGGRVGRSEYGRTLLAIGGRGFERRFAAAAFGESRSQLERRLEGMMTRSDKGMLATAVMGFVAGGVTVAAFLLPRPQDDAATSAAFEATAEPAVVLDRSERSDPDLPEPAEAPARPDLSEPVFTPYTVAPELTNVAEVVEAMNVEYPPVLRDAGIGGRVVVWFFVNTDGQVERTRVAQSSGHAALDDAALRVAEQFRLTPALNGDRPTPVWVQFPITFSVPVGDEGDRPAGTRGS